MNKYTIVANGVKFGTYEAESVKDAILTMVKDAGYDTVEEASMAVNLNIDDFVDQLEITEEF